MSEFLHEKSIFWPRIALLSWRGNKLTQNTPVDVIPPKQLRVIVGSRHD